MATHKIVVGALLAALLASGCSRQQSDWQKTRETNTADAYEQFLKKYPTGEFTPQAQARVKELYEERDWQKARDADTPEAYQAFLKQYPEGKWTEEARIRVENFTLAQAPGSVASGAAGAPGAIAPRSAAASPPAGTESGPAPSSNSPPSEPAETPPAVAAAPKARTPTAAAAAGAADKTPSGGAYRVQLGAFKSGADAANQRWAHLRKAYPSVFAGLSSKVVPLKTADGNLYRLQTTGLSQKQARRVCSAMKAKSEACIVVPPAHG